MKLNALMKRGLNGAIVRRCFIARSNTITVNKNTVNKNLFNNLIANLIANLVNRTVKRVVNDAATKVAVTKSTMSKLLSALSALLMCGVAAAVELPVQPFSGSTLIQNQQFEKPADYRLPLGGLKRNQGVLLPEESRKIYARKAAFTHVIDRSNLPSEVLDYFLSEFKKQKFEIIFQCRAMACGDNSHWANTVFKQRKLNGDDRSQYLFTLKRNSGQDYLIFYLVQRGNKSVFTHLEWFYDAEQQVASVDQIDVYDLLLKQNRVELKNIIISKDGSLSEDENEAAMASISKLLQDYPNLNLVIVGHDESRPTLQKSLEFSTLIAENAAVAIDSQPSGSLLPSYGVGSLAPLQNQMKAGDKPPYWLELVLLP